MKCFQRFHGKAVAGRTGTTFNNPVTLVIVLVLTSLSSMLRAGEYNEVLSIGDTIPAWKDLPGTDGQRHSLDELKEKSYLVVVFTCASCPTAVDYEGRINDLITTYAAAEKSVAVVPICVNKIEEDQLPALTRRVSQRSLKFHYLYDETQAIAKAFGAIFTPEFFVFGPNRKLIYMGALDDSTDPANVKRNYVEEAIAADLQNRQPTVKETIARGCRVRYARERRSRE